MYKQFLLLLIFIFYTNIFAQVVIKDEIILDEKNIYETENPDEENLTMPFYGNAFIRFIAPGQKMRAYFTVDRQTKFLNEISGATYNCSCGLPLWSMDVQWTFSDVPAARDVELEVLQCQQVSPTPPPSGTCDWVELPVEFNEDTQTDDKWNISVDVNYPNTPPDWRYSGYILFTSTTPPGCFACSENRDEICEECIDPQNLLPDINLVEVPVGTDGLNPCADDTLGLTHGAFQISNSGLLNYNFKLGACYNTELQRWWFAIEGNELNFKFVIDYCYQHISNLGATLIDDYEDFPQGYSCDSILNDINTYYSYGAVPQGGYILKSMIQGHELQHYLDVLLLVQIQKEILFLELLEEAPLCEEFGSVEEAAQYWRANPDRFGKLVVDFWDDIYNYHQPTVNNFAYEHSTHKNVYHNFDQIKINALCYWNCTNLLPPNTTCP